MACWFPSLAKTPATLLPGGPSHPRYRVTSAYPWREPPFSCCRTQFLHPPASSYRGCLRLTFPCPGHRMGKSNRHQRSRVFLPEMPSVSVPSLISMALEAGRPRSKCWPVWGEPASGFTGSCLGPRRAEGARCSLGSLPRTRLPFRRTGPRHRPEAPPPGAIMLGLRCQRMDSVGTQLSFWSTPVLGKGLPQPPLFLSSSPPASNTVGEDWCRAPPLPSEG